MKDFFASMIAMAIIGFLLLIDAPIGVFVAVMFIGYGASIALSKRG